jgi:hypothetical protein
VRQRGARVDLDSPVHLVVDQDDAPLVAQVSQGDERVAVRNEPGRVVGEVDHHGPGVGTQEVLEPVEVQGPPQIPAGPHPQRESGDARRTRQGDALDRLVVRDGDDGMATVSQQLGQQPEQGLLCPGEGEDVGGCESVVLSSHRLAELARPVGRPIPEVDPREVIDGHAREVQELTDADRLRVRGGEGVGRSELPLREPRLQPEVRQCADHPENSLRRL